MSKNKKPGRPIFLPPDEGRHYDMGKIRAVFKADEEDTKAQFCISEWWLDPHTEGPGAHSHEHNHDIFYVLEGIVSILVDENWIEAAKGSFIYVPQNIIHDFRNNTARKAGVLNFFIPGGFERNMPAVVEWFKTKGQFS